VEVGFRNVSRRRRAIVPIPFSGMIRGSEECSWECVLGVCLS